MSKRVSTWVVALVALTALPAWAVKNEETAFGGAKLGATKAQVQKAYPKMEPTSENLGAQAFPSELLTRYVVKDVTVPETKQKGTLELRFWKDKLWAIIIYYGDGNDPKVVAAFTERMGPPNGTNPQKPSWQGDKSLTFVETEHHWYSVTDDALSKDAQAWFFARLDSLKGAVVNQQPPVATTPAAAVPATPAAPAATPAK